jgi:hypothetical protein
MANYAKCGLCGSQNEYVFKDSNLIDSGWTLNWLNLGYYGGFTDCIPGNLADVYSIAEYDETPYTVNMCHACCVKLIDTFPALKEVARVRGGHPNMNEHDPSNGTATPPCCPYAWTWVDVSDSSFMPKYETYFATDELTWELQAD